MLRLDLKKEPYWLELRPGLRVRVRPLTTAIMTAADSTARKLVAELREERQLRIAAGGDLSDLPDLENEDAVSGLAASVMIKALARMSILEWEGVMRADSDEPAIINEQTVNDLMDIWFVADAFWKQYTRPLELLEAEGNGSGPARNGTSAAGPDTVESAGTSDSPAA
jgi:hypothetical protein